MFLIYTSDFTSAQTLGTLHDAYPGTAWLGSEAIANGGQERPRPGYSQMETEHEHTRISLMNELRVSNARGDVYRLYRVFEFSQFPKVFIVKGPLSQNLTLRAVQHIALPANLDRVESPLLD
jgi:hypothetical protein